MAPQFSNCILYLIGFPGTGKYTVGKAIAETAGFKLIDNHFINNPVFSLIHHDGVTPLPPPAFKNANRIREVLLDTIVHLSPPDYNFIFTNVLRHDDEEDAQIYRDVEQAAQKRGAHFVPVRMSCSIEEMEKRIISEDRKERFKMIDRSAPAELSANFEILNIPHENLLHIDVSGLPAIEAARQILNHARSCVPAS